MQDISKVPTEWRRFIPHAPSNPDQLPVRIHHPTFLKAPDGRAIMIRAAGSDTAFPKRLLADLKDLAEAPPSALGVIIDADDNTAIHRLQSVNQAIAEHAKISPPEVQFPEPPGTVMLVGCLRLGMFVAPDNQSSGVIESLILEGGKEHYQNLTYLADSYIDGIQEKDVPDSKQWIEFLKWDRAKSRIHAVGAILRPGRPTQATLESDDWLEGANLKMASRLRSFLVELLR